MAERQVISSLISNDGVARVLWTGLLNGDTGSGVALGRFADKSVAAYGTFGVGGSVTFEGSWDGGTTWSAIHDPQGIAVALVTADPVAMLVESPPLIRPRVIAGDGTTALSVEIAAVAT